MSKPRFLLTASQWIGTFCLLGAVALIVLFIQLIPQPVLPPVPQVDTLAQVVPDEEVYVGSHDSGFESRKPTMYPFNPNTADSLLLLKNGLRPWQAHNLIRYRQAGGRFRKPEDMKKLYGLSEEQYRTLRPYIRIPHTPSDTPLHKDTARRDTFPKYVSLKRDTVLELNTADTAQLQLLKGIGPWTAVQIVRYRSQLGGYYSPLQLREIPHIDQQMLDTVLRHFTVDTILITKMAVNRLGVAQLKRHPYIRFEQAKSIYELRRQRITLHSMEELYSLPALSDSDVLRLKPYMSFEKM